MLGSPTPGGWEWSPWEGEMEWAARRLTLGGKRGGEGRGGVGKGERTGGGGEDKGDLT